jgi:hypothetical protein
VIAIALWLSACSASGPAPETMTAPSSTATTALPSAAAASLALSPSMRPSPTPITDLAQVFRPLATGWRPTGPTLVIGRYADGGESTLIAVPLGSSGRLGPATPIVDLAQGSWALRADGGAVVIGVGPGTGRLAIWDVRSGEARWLTTFDHGGGSPVWSRDGSTIYYASIGDDGKPGIFQIGADGLGRKALFTHERFGQLEGLTPDGGGLIWRRGQAGASVDIFDLTTRMNRELEGNARVTSWRVRQPRLLLSVGGCCAGRPGGSLVAWNDLAMTSQVVAERGQYGDPAFGRAAWDPTGTRIAGYEFNNASYQPTLVILDPATGATQPLAGAEGAGGWILWLAEGIVFTTGRARTQPPGFILKLLPSAGGTAVSLYEDAGSIQRIDVIRP